MNICIITSSSPSNPDDRVQAPFLFGFIEGLNKRGHRVFLFTQDRKGVKKPFSEGVQMAWFPWTKTEKPLVRLNLMNPLDCLRIGNLFYQGRKTLPPFLIQNKIDACLALWVLPSGYFANHAHRRTGIPYSIWALGSDIYRYGTNPLLFPLMQRIVQEARGVFADGFDLCKRVEEQFKKKCHFLATTRRLDLELDELHKLEELNKPSRPKTPYRFLFIGRIEKVKGIDLLLHASALLKEDGLAPHLTIVGKGSLEAWARNFVNQMKLGKWITFKGNVDDRTLVSLYTLSDCVVIPSRSESIPMVFSEALNFDKELIVTDVGDMGMLGRQYGVASVTPPEDTVALKEVMKKRIESQERTGGDRQKKSELKRLFNIETSVERFLEDYE
jgi:glycosyltransferase involved in cell wall biosynthesis